MAVSEEDGQVVINSDLSTLQSFILANQIQGIAKWIGLDLNTNVNDITKLTLNGSALTTDNVAEAASVGLGPGHIVFWVGADQLPKTVTIGGNGYRPVEIKIIFVTNFQEEPNPGHSNI